MRHVKRLRHGKGIFSNMMMKMMPSPLKLAAMGGVAGASGLLAYKTGNKVLNNVSKALSNTKAGISNTASKVTNFIKNTPMYESASKTANSMNKMANKMGLVPDQFHDAQEPPTQGINKQAIVTQMASKDNKYVPDQSNVKIQGLRDTKAAYKELQQQKPFLTPDVYAQEVEKQKNLRANDIARLKKVQEFTNMTKNSGLSKSELSKYLTDKANAQKIARNTQPSKQKLFGALDAADLKSRIASGRKRIGNGNLPKEYYRLNKRVREATGIRGGNIFGKVKKVPAQFDPSLIEKEGKGKKRIGKGFWDGVYKLAQHQHDPIGGKRRRQRIKNVNSKQIKV